MKPTTYRIEQYAQSNRIDYTNIMLTAIVIIVYALTLYFGYRAYLYRNTVDKYCHYYPHTDAEFIKADSLRIEAEKLNP